MKEYCLAMGGHGDNKAIVQELQEIAGTVKPGDYIGIGFELSRDGRLKEIPTIVRVISCRFQGSVNRFWNGEKAPEIVLELSDGTQFLLSGNHPYISYDIQRIIMKKLDTIDYYKNLMDRSVAEAVLITIYNGASEAEKALIAYNKTLEIREEAKKQREADQRKRFEEERHRESQAQYEAIKKAAEDARAAQNLDSLFRGGFVRSGASEGNEKSSARSSGNIGNSGNLGSPVEYLFMTCACGARLRYRKNRTNIVITCSSCGREYKL